MKAASTTRVVAIGGQEGIALEDRSLEGPSTGEALLRVRVSGLCGTDLFKLRNAPPPLGTVLGHEIVGEVVELGPEVSGLEEGDRIVLPHHVACGTCPVCKGDNEPLCSAFSDNLFSPGGFAQYLIARSAAVSAAHRVPKNLTDEAAVFFEPLACVVRAVRRSTLLARPQTTEVVTVQGGGSMGLLHLLALRALLPAATVALIEPRADRRALAEKLGAVALTPDEDAPGRGHPTSVIFDTVGGSSAVEWALERISAGGTVVLFAHGNPSRAQAFPFNRFFKGEHRLVASYSSGLDDQAQAFRLLAEGLADPTPLATHRLALERFQDGVDLAESLTALKVLFYPSSLP